MKRLLTILANNKVSMDEYVCLFKLHLGELGFDAEWSDLRKLVMLGLVRETHPEHNAVVYSITDEGKDLVNIIEDLFKKKASPKKKFVMTTEFRNWVDEYLSLWPDSEELPNGVLPSGKKARVNPKELEKPFAKFFTKYDYDQTTVLLATSLYVLEYKKKGYNFMRTSQYFINKRVNGVEESELANYCERIINGDFNTKSSHLSDKVF